MSNHQRHISEAEEIALGNLGLCFGDDQWEDVDNAYRSGDGTLVGLVRERMAEVLGGDPSATPEDRTDAAWAAWHLVQRAERLLSPEDMRSLHVPSNLGRVMVYLWREATSTRNDIATLLQGVGEDDALAPAQAEAERRGDHDAVAGLELARGITSQRPWRTASLLLGGQAFAERAFATLAVHGHGSLANFVAMQDARPEDFAGPVRTSFAEAVKVAIARAGAGRDQDLDPMLLPAFRRLVEMGDMSSETADACVRLLVDRGEVALALEAAQTAARSGYAVVGGLVALTGLVDEGGLRSLESSLEALGALSERTRAQQRARRAEQRGDVDAMVAELVRATRDGHFDGTELIEPAVRQAHVGAAACIDEMIAEGSATELLLRGYLKALREVGAHDRAIAVADHLVRAGFDGGTAFAGLHAVEGGQAVARLRALREEGYALSGLIDRWLTGGEHGALDGSGGRSRPRGRARRVPVNHPPQASAPTMGMSLSLQASVSLHWLLASFVDEHGRVAGEPLVRALEAVATSAHAEPRADGTSDVAAFLRGVSHRGSARLEVERLHAMELGEDGSASMDSTSSIRAYDTLVLGALFSGDAVLDAFASHLGSRSGADATRVRILLGDSAAGLLFAGTALDPQTFRFAVPSSPQVTRSSLRQTTSGRSTSW